MENELNVEQQVPSGILTGITISILDEEDAVSVQFRTLRYISRINFFQVKNLVLMSLLIYQEKMSVKIIEAAADVTDPNLGLPNPTTSQCPTCGARDVRSCEGKITH